MAWERVPFGRAATDVTSASPRLPKGEYAEGGTFPVIDQGADEIAGYTDDPTVVTRIDSPRILFGDHTRRFKRVISDFVVGADGIKVLRPASDFDAGFLFRYLESLDIPSAGYSRHFKFLKDVTVPLPPLPEQRRIAAILDRADSLHRKRLKQLALLEEASNRRIQSILDHAEESRSLNDLLTEPLRNGVSPSRSGTTEQKVLTLSAITRGRFDPSQSKLDLFAKLPAGDKWAREGMILICRGNGNPELVGRMVVVDAIEGDVIFPDTMIASRVSAQVSIPTLLAAWRTDAVRAQISARARTTNGTYKINQQSLGGVLVPVPSAEDQARIDAIDAERVSIHAMLSASMTRFDTLFMSLQHRAFRGEL